jgi:hypothetical protein
MRLTEIETEILRCTDDKFNALARKIFDFQSVNCSLYQQWLQINDNGKHGPLIPFLPVSFFKTHELRSWDAQADEKCFKSSSTSGTGESRHFVPFPAWYEAIFEDIFNRFYGEASQYHFIALLPGYMDRPDSSLVYMAEKLLKKAAAHSFSTTDIQIAKKHIEASNKPVFLLGVTFALLEMAELGTIQFPEGSIVMETGGMKGRRKEMIREEVHQILTDRFGMQEIHSEYGMTELMSQAYSKGMGVFNCPPWMRITITDPSDPGCELPMGKTGRICITDLGNLYSCAFIASDDLGKLHPDGSFEVRGRADFSDVRGCNLMWG